MRVLMRRILRVSVFPRGGRLQRILVSIVVEAASPLPRFVDDALKRYTTPGPGIAEQLPVQQKGLQGRKRAGFNAWK